jgi:hypothetical protein
MLACVETNGGLGTYMGTPFLWGMVQGSRVLALGRHLWVLLLGGVLVLTPLPYLWIMTTCNTHNKCLRAQALDIGDLL